MLEKGFVWTAVYGVFFSLNLLWTLLGMNPTPWHSKAFTATITLTTHWVLLTYSFFKTFFYKLVPARQKVLDKHILFLFDLGNLELWETASYLKDSPGDDTFL